MRTNRSIPATTVVPVLVYPDVDAAAQWLCDAFGFRPWLRLEGQRAQLHVGDGAVVLTRERVAHGFDAPAGEFRAPRPGEFAHSMLVRVEDLGAHHERAAAAGATIRRPPEDFPYGERQYVAQDLAGHRWTFSQTLADVDPADWGAEPAATSEGAPAAARGKAPSG